MSRTIIHAALLTVAVAAGGTVFVGGCGNAEPTPTSSTCPAGSMLTYDNFGKPFMEAYCTRCHASTLSGPDRHGAPLYHDFDSLIGVLQVANHVDEYAAGGPDAVNDIMPPDGDKPSEQERRQLGEWLACELEHRTPPDAGVEEADAAPAADASEEPDATGEPDAAAAAAGGEGHAQP